MDVDLRRNLSNLTGWWRGAFHIGGGWNNLLQSEDKWQIDSVYEEGT